MNKEMRDLPRPQGLYDPSYEHDACGIGIVANIKGKKSYGIIDDALTILENLRWGDEHATLAECQRACRLACADEFIEKMPDGYDTYIEQGGTNVSGGQKQRLCIARALLKKPKILILDDSTSAVDTRTDALIRSAFVKEIPNTTKIIIAQRIASVQEADMILVLDDGKIVSCGTHDELMQTSPIYREVYESQTKGDPDNATAS